MNEHNSITVPTTVFYILLAGPIIAVVATSVVWANQLSDLRSHVRSEDAVKARMMEVMFMNGLKPTTNLQPDKNLSPSGLQYR